MAGTNSPIQASRHSDPGTAGGALPIDDPDPVAGQYQRCRMGSAHAGIPAGRDAAGRGKAAAGFASIATRLAGCAF